MKNLPLLLLALAILIAAGIWALGNTWQYNHAGIALVRVNRWTGRTQMMTGRGWINR